MMASRSSADATQRRNRARDGSSCAGVAYCTASVNLLTLVGSSSPRLARAGQQPGECGHGFVVADGEQVVAHVKLAVGPTGLCALGKTRRNPAAFFAGDAIACCSQRVGGKP